MAQTDMTTGNIKKHLISYSIPLILGNVFQLTYNVVDSAIAGRFIGKEALAAEGIASPVMNIIILGISGLCMGAGVLMSEYFGAKDFKNLRREMSTTLLSGFLLSMAVVLLGVLFARPLLVLLNVPENILTMAETYLKIIFIGAPFTYFYNALSSALKSVGDSKTPLKFLMFSSILNGVLDIIFIGLLGFGIVCSAVTTVIAEGVSAVLSIVYIYLKVPALSLKYKDLRIDGQLLKKTLQYGSVTALQQSCQPVGKLLIQGCVNSLGVDIIAAFNAVTRVDDFAFTPEQSISHGITTFVAQNRGSAAAKQAKTPEGTARQTTISSRIRKGFQAGLVLEFLYWIGICVVTLLCKKYLMMIFVTGEGSDAIITIGSRYLKTMAFFYLFPAFTNGIQGFFRGMGKMKTTLLATFIQTSIRVIATWILAPKTGIYGITFACAIGWSCMLLFEVPYYFYCKNISGAVCTDFPVQTVHASIGLLLAVFNIDFSP